MVHRLGIIAYSVGTIGPQFTKMHMIMKNLVTNAKGKEISHKDKDLL